MIRKRYIVAISKRTLEEDQTFIAFLKDEKVGWWHWMDNLWLITTSKEHFTASYIRDKIIELYESDRILVIELKDGKDTWSGKGPNSEDKNMFKWLKTAWKRK